MPKHNLKEVSVIGNAPRLLAGFEAKLVFLRIFSSILRLALRAYQDPLTAIRTSIALMAKKQAIVGRIKNIRLARSNGRYFWSIAATGWPSQAFDDFILNEMNKIRKFRAQKGFLQSIVFSITSRCPLFCEHCYEWDQLSEREQLSLPELISILHEFQSYGVSNVQFSGGEPLCRFDDLIALMDSARPGTDFWVLTSGFGLTAEKAARLAKAGLAGVVISLDHFEAQAHNQFRHHEDSYRWVFEASQNASQAGLVVAFSLCAARSFVTSQNLRRYLDLAKRSGVMMVRILEPRTVGHYRGCDIELDEARIALLTRLYLTNIHAPSHLTMPILEYSGYYQRHYGCFAAGDRSLYVDTRGDVHACPFCQNPVGNALRDPLPPLVLKLQEVGCHKFKYRISEAEISEHM